MNNNLYCPNCKNKLIIAGTSRYQNLIEHVHDPNGFPTIKDEYRCKNKCYPHRVFWDCFGDVYVSPTWVQKIFWKFRIYGIFKNINVKEAIKKDD